jgi:hypothetical protein
MTRDPGPDDDANHGHMFHHVWWNTVTDEWFVNMGADPGNAVWERVEADPPPGFPAHRHRRRHHRRHHADGRRHMPHHSSPVAMPYAGDPATPTKENMECNQSAPILPVVTTLRDETWGGRGWGRDGWCRDDRGWGYAENFLFSERGQRDTDREVNRSFEGLRRDIFTVGDRLGDGQRATDMNVDTNGRFLTQEVQGVDRDVLLGFRAASNEQEQIARFLAARNERTEDKVEATRDILGTAIGAVRDRVTEVRGEVREAALRNELETLKAKCELQRDISEDGQKTRALIDRREERRLEDRIRELELLALRHRDGRDRDRDDHHRELRDIDRNQNRNTVVVNDSNSSTNRNANENLQFQLLLEEARRRRRDDDCCGGGGCGHHHGDRVIFAQAQAQDQRQAQGQEQSDRININIRNTAEEDRNSRNRNRRVVFVDDDDDRFTSRGGERDPRMSV